MKILDYLTVKIFKKVGVKVKLPPVKKTQKTAKNGFHGHFWFSREKKTLPPTPGPSSARYFHVAHTSLIPPSTRGQTWNSGFYFESNAPIVHPCFFLNRRIFFATIFRPCFFFAHVPAFPNNKKKTHPSNKKKLVYHFSKCFGQLFCIQRLYQRILLHF